MNRSLKGIRNSERSIMWAARRIWPNCCAANMGWVGRRTGASRPELRTEIEWTFPLKFAEVISGDGQKVYRERIELADTSAFDQRKLTLRPELRGRKWVRFEVWDVAANGAFTQPVWLGE